MDMNKYAGQQEPNYGELARKILQEARPSLILAQALHLNSFTSDRQEVMLRLPILRDLTIIL